jgi:hypothetical protein
MSKDHEGDIKQYIHTSEAWYASSSLANEKYVDEVTFGFYAPGGGTSGEMGVRWYDLSRPYIKGERHIAPRLECFSDAWHALWQLKDVLMALAHFDDQDITPEDFCKILDHCGFTDNTPRKDKVGVE